MTYQPLHELNCRTPGLLQWIVIYVLYICYWYLYLWTHIFKLFLETTLTGVSFLGITLGTCCDILLSIFMTYFLFFSTCISIWGLLLILPFMRLFLTNISKLTSLYPFLMQTCKFLSILSLVTVSYYLSSWFNYYILCTLVSVNLTIPSLDY